MAELQGVKVNCRACGPTVVQPSDLHVTPTDTGTGLCVFVCPSCSREVWQAADASTLLALRSVGAQPLEGVAPLELTERHQGLPISWDELLESHEAMRDHCCPQDELTG